MSLSAKCCVCTDEFQGIDDLEAHISADHYNCLPFECEKCKFAKFPTEFAIKRHYEEDHGLVEYFIRYRVSREIYEKKQKIRECLERCIRHSDASQHQINLSNRSIIGGDYSSTLSHYQSRLHENEFLAPTSSKIRGNHTTTAELFQQQHGPLLSSTAADLRHQHQSDFVIGTTANDADSVSGYETIGGPNLIGNLLEQIKPDVDGGSLSHFDQLYATEVTSANDTSARGIEKFTIQQSSISSQSDQLSPFLSQTQKSQQLGTEISGTGSGSSVTTTVTLGTPVTVKSQLNGTPLSSISFKQSGSRRPGELQCQMCKQMVVNRSTSLMYHVNVKHLKLAMYRCLHCGETFMWNKSAAIRHAQQRHGGDESLIENNNERLFPTLNRHRREYFNLAKRGPEDSPTPPRQLDSETTREQREEDATEMSITSKKSRMDSDGTDTPEFIEVKNEEVTEVEHDQLTDEPTMDAQGRTQEKKAPQTPNTILAQLVDMTRSNNSTSIEGKVLKIGPSPSMTATAPSTSISRVIQQQPSGNISLNLLGEPIKVHKQIKCEGCGDNVINQEWILLNHVNTKHLHLPLYQCVSCNKPFENYLRSYAVRHTKFYHAGDESLLTDQRDKYWGELREACAQLFGLNGNTNKNGAACGAD